MRIERAFLCLLICFVTFGFLIVYFPCCVFFRRWGFLRRDCVIVNVPLVVQSVIVVLWESTVWVPIGP